MVKWLKVGGFLFFRESCFHQSGDFKRKNNPTHYREPRFYTKAFKECHLSDDLGNSFELTLITFKCVGAYVRNKKNQNQAMNLSAFQLEFLPFFLTHSASNKPSLFLLSFAMQIYWLWQKANSQNDKGFQRFLDSVQYKCRGILRYEQVFGEGFVSTGGLGMQNDLPTVRKVLMLTDQTKFS